MTDSLLYQGKVTHHRFLPREHQFRYRVMMPLLYLDEIATLHHDLRGLALEGRVLDVNVRPTWRHLLPGQFVLRRSDYLPTYEGSLDRAVRQMHYELTGEVHEGRVAMMANLRSLGWNFNPITLYFFYEGDEVTRTIAEVTNTPWGERHCYVLGPPGVTVFGKEHHVSPFLDMSGTYRLAYQAPLEHFTLSMTLHDHGDRNELGVRRLSATMQFDGRLLNQVALNDVRWRYPDMAFRVSLRIYFQAVRLFAKGIKFVPHPRLRKDLPA